MMPHVVPPWPYKMSMWNKVVLLPRVLVFTGGGGVLSHSPAPSTDLCLLPGAYFLTGGGGGIPTPLTHRLLVGLL